MTEELSWWEKPYGREEEPLQLESGWEEWVAENTLVDLIRALADFSEEELSRVLGCAGELYEENTLHVFPTPDTLMHACLFTAMVWERG